jgi:hypothetical protein
MDDLAEPSTSRRGFLRKLGTTMAVGIGVAMAPSLAKGSPQYISYQCCPNENKGCPTCNNSFVPYWCTNAECPGGFCYGCLPRGQGCRQDLEPFCV